LTDRTAGSPSVPAANNAFQLTAEIQAFLMAGERKSISRVVNDILFSPAAERWPLGGSILQG
jgi:hypothetical protein